MTTEIEKYKEKSTALNKFKKKEEFNNNTYIAYFKKYQQKKNQQPNNYCRIATTTKTAS